MRALSIATEIGGDVRQGISFYHKEFKTEP